MKNRKKTRKTSLCLLAALLVLSLLLSACDQSPAAPAAPAESAAPAETAVPETTAEPTPEPVPEPTEEPAPASPWEVEEPPIETPEWTSIQVTTVDQMLGAIAPETTVVLAPGVYDLSTASDYGQESRSEYYYWEPVYDGYQLVLQNMDGMQIVAPEGAEIVTAPRYAYVLNLRGCNDLLLAGLTVGHTPEPGICSGGVLYLAESDGARVRSCRLYGCGTSGLDAFNCENLGVSFTEIYDCSFWGLTAYLCRDVLMEDCWIHDCGKTESYQLLQIRDCRGFAVVNTRISGNRAHVILDSQDSPDTVMAGCTVEDNQIYGSVFYFEGYGAIVEDCGFTLKKGTVYYERSGDFILARERSGNDLTSFDLDRMERRRVQWDGIGAASAEDSDPAAQSAEVREVRVSTVDELLEAIAPDTRVILAPGTYDLSQAAGYGGVGGKWYTWEQRYDGPSLSIQNVSNLHLEGAGTGETVILAKPRYASVFSFSNCDSLSLSGLTLGHTDEGYCAGNVVDLMGCRRVEIAECGLFGCGVIGVTGQGCRGVHLVNTEIYACSDGAAEFSACRDLSMDGCSIHDCKDGRDRIFLQGCTLLWNGETLEEGLHRFDHEDYLGPVIAD